MENEEEKKDCNHEWFGNGVSVPCSKEDMVVSFIYCRKCGNHNFERINQAH